MDDVPAQIAVALLGRNLRVQDGLAAADKAELRDWFRELNRPPEGRTNPEPAPRPFGRRRCAPWRRGSLKSSLGDCTTVPYKQIVIAAGEGDKAALGAFDYLIRT
ncbi:MAG: hypothetical protein LBR21_06995 [Propionibacteriaceae bacterium]|nr:hypothetical protein [Propionibacteriaceae bacterium]